VHFFLAQYGNISVSLNHSHSLSPTTISYCLCQNASVSILLFNYLSRIVMVSISGRFFSALLAFFLFTISLFFISFIAAFSQISGAAVPFLRFAPDAQHQAMGRTGTGVVGNGNAAFWNIAAAAPQKTAFSENGNEQGTLSVLSPLAGYVGAANSVQLYGAYQGLRLGSGNLAASFTYFGGTTAQFDTTKGQRSFNEFAITLGYAAMVNDDVSIGAQVRYIESNLSDARSNFNNIGRGFSMDVGVLWNPAQFAGIPLDKRVSVGAVLKNIGPALTYNQFADPLPMEFRAGIAAEVLRDGAHRIRVQGDIATLLVNRTANGSFDAALVALVTGWRNPLEVGIGVEYSFEQRIFVRGGYFTDNNIILHTPFRRVSVGAGARFGVFVLDAVLDFPINGGTVSPTLTWRFPVNVAPSVPAPSVVAPSVQAGS
jgi:Type IX secretion system protein PorV